jgi:hypothetical protein
MIDDPQRPVPTMKRGAVVAVEALASSSRKLLICSVTDYNEWVLLCHDQFNFIIRYEKLQDDFAEVLQAIGLKRVRQLPVVNKTALKNTVFTDYYSPEIQQRALYVFGPFMKKWGYEFPSEWPSVTVPISSQISFSLIDAAANGLARRICVSPRNRLLGTTKRCIYRMQSALRAIGAGKLSRFKGRRIRFVDRGES